MKFLPIDPIREFTPYGKESMVKGGVGSIRLAPSIIMKKEIYFWGATSSGVIHEGVPLIIEEALYKQNIENIKNNGGIIADIIGRLILLPDYIESINFEPLVPTDCLWVENIKTLSIPQADEISISIAINYSSTKELEKLHYSFVTFNPDNKEKNIVNAVDWLNDYAKRHSEVNDPIILGDFDAHRKYFKNVLIEMKDLQNGNVRPEIIKYFSKFYKFSIMPIENYNINDSPGSAVGPNASSTGHTFNQTNNNAPQLDTKTIWE